MLRMHDVAGTASDEELHSLAALLAGAGPPHSWQHLTAAQLGFAAAAAGEASQDARWQWPAACHEALFQACAKGEHPFVLCGRCRCSVRL